MTLVQHRNNQTIRLSENNKNKLKVGIEKARNIPDSDRKTYIPSLKQLCWQKNFLIFLKIFSTDKRRIFYKSVLGTLGNIFFIYFFHWNQIR